MIVTAKEIAFSNDVGGTELMTGAFKVEVDDQHFDYETGVILHGRLLNTRDIARARKKGTTGFKPSDYKKYGKLAVIKAQVDREQFDPSRVHMFASECDWRDPT